MPNENLIVPNLFDEAPAATAPEEIIKPVASITENDLVVPDLFTEETPAAPEVDLEKQYKGRETAKLQTEQQAAAQAAEAKAKEEDPANWTAEKTKQYWKDNPPKTPQEAAQAKAAIKIKEEQEKALAEGITGPILTAGERPKGQVGFATNALKSDPTAPMSDKERALAYKQITLSKMGISENTARDILGAPSQEQEKMLNFLMTRAPLIAPMISGGITVTQLLAFEAIQQAQNFGIPLSKKEKVDLSNVIQDRLLLPELLPADTKEGIKVAAGFAQGLAETAAIGKVRNYNDLKEIVTDAADRVKAVPRIAKEKALSVEDVRITKEKLLIKNPGMEPETAQALAEYLSGQKMAGKSQVVIEQMIEKPDILKNAIKTIEAEKGVKLEMPEIKLPEAAAEAPRAEGDYLSASGSRFNAAFFDTRSGKVIDTGSVHDLNKLSGEDQKIMDDEEGQNIDNYKRTIQDGFIDNKTGEFILRGDLQEKFDKGELTIDDLQSPEKTKAKALKQSVELLPEDKDVAGQMKADIEEGSPVVRKVIRDDSGDVVNVVAETATGGLPFPDYFKGKGYTKKETLSIIDKVLSGEKVTPKQKAIFDDLLEGKKRALQEEETRYEREHAEEVERLAREGAQGPEIQEANRIGEEQAQGEIDEANAREVEKFFEERAANLGWKQNVSDIIDKNVFKETVSQAIQVDGQRVINAARKGDVQALQAIQNKYIRDKGIDENGSGVGPGRVAKPRPGAVAVWNAAQKSIEKIQSAKQKSTQKELVKKAVSEKPKSIKEVSEETGILEPNVRRILGTGAKEGTFSRIDKGVYVLNQNGKDVAYIHTGDAISTLPKLAADGFKADMVFLDIPYKTPAVIGGNRGIKYDYITPAQFQEVVKSVSKIVRDDNAAVFYMYSQARSGEKAMKQYTDVILKSFKPVARGEYTKLQLDGVTRVRNMRGDVVEPEGLLLLTKSGNLDKAVTDNDIKFKLIRPKGYQTEKPATMLKKLIELTTEEGEVVLDPFAGSGVTIEQAVKSGRVGVGIEKSEKAIEEHIKPRLEAAAKAKLGSGGTPGSYEPEKDNIPAGEKVPDTGIAKIDIVKMLEEKLGTPIRKGKFRQKALGIFKGGYAYSERHTSPDVIRLKQENWVGTAAHEIGHDFDKRFLITQSMKEKGKYVEPYRSELIAIASRPAVPTKGAEIAEGVAQYVKYFVVDPAKVEKELPNFHKKFLDIMNREYPEGLEVLLQARKDYKRWLEQDPRAEISASIERKVTEPSVNLWQQARTQFIDDLAPIDDFMKLTRSLGVNVPTRSDAYLLSRLLKGWEGVAVNFLEKGTVDYNTGEINGKGLREIIKPFEDKKILEEFEEYLVAKRAAELHGRQIETGLNGEKVLKALELYEKENPEFIPASEEIYAYNDRLLQYLVDAGVISTEQRIKMKELNKYHVPFYRVLEEANTAFGTGAKMASVSSPIKKIRGSAKKIVPPLESILKNTYAFINVAERNAIGQAMASLASENSILGQSFEHIPNPISKVASVDIQKEILDKVFPEVGPYSEVRAAIDQLMGEAGIDDVYNVFRPSFFVPGENVVSVLRSGKKAFYQVDPDLYKALMALNKEHIHTLFRILAIPASWLRAGATLTPEFIARNPLRDQWSAFVFSKYGYVPGWDLMKGLFHSVNKTDLYYEWQRSKAINATLVGMDRKNLQKSVRDLVHKKIIFNPLELLRILSSFGEQGTRIGGFIRAKKALAKKGITGKEAQMLAGYESRELTLDFNRAGATGRAVNMIVAFWNANIQDYSKIHRTFKDPATRDTAFIKAILGLTVPSIILWLLNHDDKRYKEIPRWQKMAFWIVLTPKHIYRIPKPFALGSLFGSSVEAALDFISQNDPKAIEKFAANFLKQNTPGIAPTAAIPIIENWANKSTFYDRPIVSESKQRLLPEYQYNDWTSETMKKTGEMLHFSPAMGENLIRGYFANLGLLGLDISDFVGAKTGILPEKKEAGKVNEAPIIKAFEVKEPIGSNSQSVNDFYELKDKWEKVSATAKNLNDEGNIKEAKELLQKSGFTEKQAGTIKVATKAMKELRDYREKIRNSNIDLEKKDRLLKVIDKNMTRIAERALR